VSRGRSEHPHSGWLQQAKSSTTKKRKSDMDNTANKGKINTIEKLDFKKVTHENKGFTTYLNIVIQNLHNPIALAIWCYLSSLPHDWDIDKSYLNRHFEIGRDVLNKALSCLKKAKLIEFVQMRNDDGTMGNGSILVKAGYDFNRDTEIQYTGKKHNKSRVSTAILKNRKTVNRYTGKQPLQKKYIQKKDFETKETKSFLKIENAKKHDFAESMNQMACETKHIVQHEKRKQIEKSAMPIEIKRMLGIKPRK
jgi:hypothetical protein